MKIMYHYIGEKTSGTFPISWERFEKQAKLEATFTFDDGLKCHADAAEVLEANGKRGVFAIPACVLEGVWPVAHMLHKAAETRTWSELLEMSRMGIVADSSYGYTSSSDEAKAKTAYNLRMTEDSARSILEPICGDMSDWFMSVDEVRGLVVEGHTVVSHGYSHSALSKMDERDAVDDIVTAREILKAEGCNTDPAVLVLPFGDSPSESVLDRARILAVVGTKERIDCVRVE